MKQCILFFIAVICFLKLNAQDRIQMEVIKIISEKKDTILIYANDIKIFNEQSFELVDSVKVQKLKEIEVQEAYFVCKCCGDSEVYLQNILSSSIPDGNLYILVLGKNKIRFIKGSFIECSLPLIKKIKNVIK